MNIERRTSNSPKASKHLSASGGSNVEWQEMKKLAYDVEERLVQCSVKAIRIGKRLPITKPGNHVVGYLFKIENPQLVDVL